MAKKIDSHMSQVLMKDFEHIVLPVILKLKETSQVDFMPIGFRFKYKGFDSEITFKVYQ